MAETGTERKPFSIGIILLCVAIAAAGIGSSVFAYRHQQRQEQERAEEARRAEAARAEAAKAEAEAKAEAAKPPVAPAGPKVDAAADKGAIAQKEEAPDPETPAPRGKKKGKGKHRRGK